MENRLSINLIGSSMIITLAKEFAKLILGFECSRLLQTVGYNGPSAHDLGRWRELQDMIRSVHGAERRDFILHLRYHIKLQRHEQGTQPRGAEWRARCEVVSRERGDERIYIPHKPGVFLRPNQSVNHKQANAA